MSFQPPTSGGFFSRYKNLCVLRAFTVQMSMGTLRLICLPTRSRDSESPAEWLELK